MSLVQYRKPKVASLKLIGWDTSKSTSYFVNKATPEQQTQNIMSWIKQLSVINEQYDITNRNLQDFIPKSSRILIVHSDYGLKQSEPIMRQITEKQPKPKQTVVTSSKDGIDIDLTKMEKNVFYITEYLGEKYVIRSTDDGFIETYEIME